MKSRRLTSRLNAQRSRQTVGARSARILTLLGVLLISGATFAQSSGGEFEIIKHTIDNGGGQSSGGQFTLTGTIGQPDASLQTATGGQFQMTGGFWANGVVTPPGELLFSDGFESPVL